MLADYAENPPPGHVIDDPTVHLADARVFAFGPTHDRCYQPPAMVRALEKWRALETETGLRTDFCLLRAGECRELSPPLREERVADQAGAGSALPAHIADQLNALLQRRWQPHRCWVPPLSHEYHDRKSELTEICLCFEMPILIVNLMCGGRYDGPGECVRHVFGHRGQVKPAPPSKVAGAARYWLRIDASEFVTSNNTAAGMRSSAWLFGAAAVASFVAAVLAEIYLCDVCSCRALLLRRHGRGQCHRGAKATECAS
jgi:hypothetical protein